MRTSAKQHSIVALLTLSIVYLGVGPAASSASDWNVQRLQFESLFPGSPYGSLLAISCPTASLCVAAGEYNQVSASSQPTAGQAAWRTYAGPKKEYTGPPAPPGAPPNEPRPSIHGLSCPSPTLCVAVTSSGDIYATENPLAGTAAWSHLNVNDDEYETHLEAVSCPTPSFCVAVSGGAKQRNNPRNSGKIFSSHDPTGGAAAWTETPLDPSLDLRGLSCASPSLCLAVGQNGTMLVSSNPDGPASAWRTLLGAAGPAHLQGVDCLPGLCLTGNTAGNILSSTEPAAQPSQWVTRNGGASVAITGVSCPTASHCLAVDDNGDVLTSSDPTGGAEAWSIQSVLPYVPKPNPEFERQLNGMFAVSCPSTELCAIAAADGTVLTSSDPFAAEPSHRPTKHKPKRAKRPRTILAHVDDNRVKTDKPNLRMRFRFYSTGRPRGFLCKHDDSAWQACRSPSRYWFDHGRHVFRVRAVGYTGLKGPVATDRFRIYSLNAKCPCSPGSG